MDTTANVHETKTHLSKLPRHVMNGAGFIIASASKPVVFLLPLEAAQEPHTPGNDAGKVAIAVDFDASSPEFGLREHCSIPAHCCGGTRMTHSFQPQHASLLAEVAARSF